RVRCELELKWYLDVWRRSPALFLFPGVLLRTWVAFPVPKETRKRRWFVVVFLSGAAIGIVIGLLMGYALAHKHRGEKPPKPLPVQIEEARAAEAAEAKLCVEYRGWASMLRIRWAIETPPLNAIKFIPASPCAWPACRAADGPMDDVTAPT